MQEVKNLKKLNFRVICFSPFNYVGTLEPVKSNTFYSFCE